MSRALESSKARVACKAVNVRLSKCLADAQDAIEDFWHIYIGAEFFIDIP